MNKFHVYRFAYWLVLLESNSSGLDWAASIKPEAPITSELITNISSVIFPLKELCLDGRKNGVQFDRTLIAIQSIETAIKLHGEKMLIAAMRVELQHLTKSALLDLNDYQFVPIGREVANFFDQGNLFGEEVSKKFPAAKKDIHNGGNCLALELNTAAVFHFMRVAEFGLRALAKKLRVKLKDKGKSQPIEYATWDKVLVGVRNQITAAHHMTKNARRERALQFYSDMADQCSFLRDLWRNEVSHTRKEYSSGEALGVQQRVKHFMGRLAIGNI